MTFAYWLQRLARELELILGMETGAGAQYVEATGDTCWREMFDDGLTPEEAAQEEAHAAAHTH